MTAIDRTSGSAAVGLLLADRSRCWQSVAKSPTNESLQALFSKEGRPRGIDARAVVAALRATGGLRLDAVRSLENPDQRRF